MAGPRKRTLNRFIVPRWADPIGWYEAIKELDELDGRADHRRVCDHWGNYIWQVAYLRAAIANQAPE